MAKNQQTTTTSNTEETDVPQIPSKAARKVGAREIMGAEPDYDDMSERELMIANLKQSREGAKDLKHIELSVHTLSEALEVLEKRVDEGDINVKIDFAALEDALESFDKLNDESKRKVSQAARHVVRHGNWIERRLIAPVEEFADGVLVSAGKLGVGGYVLYQIGKKGWTIGKAAWKGSQGDIGGAMTDGADALADLA